MIGTDSQNGDKEAKKFGDREIYRQMEWAG